MKKLLLLSFLLLGFFSFSNEINAASKEGDLLKYANQPALSLVVSDNGVLKRRVVSYKSDISDTVNETYWDAVLETWGLSRDEARMVDEDELHSTPLKDNLKMKENSKFLLHGQVTMFAYAVTSDEKLRAVDISDYPNRILVKVPDIFFSEYEIIKDEVILTVRAGELVKVNGGNEIYYFYEGERGLSFKTFNYHNPMDTINMDEYWDAIMGLYGFEKSKARTVSTAESLLFKNNEGYMLMIDNDKYLLQNGENSKYYKVVGDGVISEVDKADYPDCKVFLLPYGYFTNYTIGKVSDISNLNVSDSSIRPDKATVSWNTEYDSASLVYYAETGSDSFSWQGVDTLSKTHSVELTGLKSFTTYKYYVNAKDASGNNVKSETKEFTTTILDSSKPDLVVNDVRFIKEGELTYFNFSIENKGVAIPEGVIIGVMAVDSDTSSVYASGYSGGLSGTKTIVSSNPIEIKDAPYRLEVVIDYGDLVNESNEDNNTYTKTLELPADVDSDDGNMVEEDAYEDNANRLITDKLDEILAELEQLRDLVKEQETKIKYLEKLTKKVEKISEKMEDALNKFITYGVDANTQKLGAGERAAVVSSYHSAFGRLPETEAELADVIKIANGRWPSITNDKAEKRAKEQFQKIYKRIPDMNNPSDNAAVTVMAYGLRQKAENRNLESEKQGIKTFRSIYGKNPSTTEDWNIMQSITYSGATRGIDTDGDLLVDSREKELGTDPNKKDTDGDGHLDGIEVANGFDPLKK